MAPLFERLSETVREESKKRRKGEAFAEVFKYKLVSSALLSASTAESAAPSPAALGSTFKILEAGEAPGVPLSGVAIVPRPYNPPGKLFVHEDEDDVFYDANDTLMPTIEELPELPPIPIISTVLLALLRFPHILLLFAVLCIPFWSAYLVEGRLGALFFPGDEHLSSESSEAEIGYEEVNIPLEGYFLTDSLVDSFNA